MPTWDIFCRVVDNFGDVGVCWRLSRQLANERQQRVRLWIDDVATLARIEPGIDATALEQSSNGVEIRRWTGDSIGGAIPHDVVIEAFACETPLSFVEAMAASGRCHAWINLEYLSAERWVEDCHRLPSPHPRLPLVKHFFFPGFTSKSGGLLREDGLLAARERFVADDSARSARWRELGVAFPGKAITASLFAYPNAAALPLLSAWTRGPRPIVCVIPDGILRDALARVFCDGVPAVGRPASSGALTVVIVPFVPQPDFDRMLWDCDINFVRGEDSFVRAQWAAKPMVWHIYPQGDDAHRPKLEAFVGRYVWAMKIPMREMVVKLFDAWNGQGNIAAAWGDIEPFLGRWTADARQWSDTLATQPDLVTQLEEMVETLL